MTSLFVEQPLLVPGFNESDIAYSVFATYFTVSDTFEGTFAQICVPPNVSVCISIKLTKYKTKIKEIIFILEEGEGDCQIG